MGDAEQYGHFEEAQEPRDVKIDEAKEALVRFFREHSDEVYYSRQLEVQFEDRFFHWITSKALRELAAEGAIQSFTTELVEHVPIRFYSSLRNRYWRRRAEEIRKLVVTYSDSTFTTALGHHGELMFDAALPTAGFMPRSRKVRDFGGRQWTRTAHDLDRVFERDGVKYGTEIKNTLDYIPIGELVVKMRMCEHLGLRPLFIVRMAPKNYIDMVRRAGGFTLVFKHQLYPHGHAPLAATVRERRGLPVDSPTAIADGTVQRFLNWHLRHLPTTPT
jgi:hypothetical protein